MRIREMCIAFRPRRGRRKCSLQLLRGRALLRDEPDPNYSVLAYYIMVVQTHWVLLFCRSHRPRHGLFGLQQCNPERIDWWVYRSQNPPC